MSTGYTFAHKLLPEASADHLGGCLVNLEASKYVLLGAKRNMILCFRNYIRNENRSFHVPGWLYEARACAIVSKPSML